MKTWEKVAAWSAAGIGGYALFKYVQSKATDALDKFSAGGGLDLGDLVKKLIAGIQIPAPVVNLDLSNLFPGLTSGASVSDPAKLSAKDVVFSGTQIGIKGFPAISNPMLWLGDSANQYDAATGYLAAVRAGTIRPGSSDGSSAGNPLQTIIKYVTEREPAPDPTNKTTVTPNNFSESGNLAGNWWDGWVKAYENMTGLEKTAVTIGGAAVATSAAVLAVKAAPLVRGTAEGAGAVGSGLGNVIKSGFDRAAEAIRNTPIRAARQAETAAAGMEAAATAARQGAPSTIGGASRARFTASGMGESFFNYINNSVGIFGILPVITGGLVNQQNIPAGADLGRRLSITAGQGDTGSPIFTDAGVFTGKYANWGGMSARDIENARFNLAEVEHYSHLIAGMESRAGAPESNIVGNEYERAVLGVGAHAGPAPGAPIATNDYERYVLGQGSYDE